MIRRAILALLLRVLILRRQQRVAEEAALSMRAR